MKRMTRAAGALVAVVAVATSAAGCASEADGEAIESNQTSSASPATGVYSRVLSRTATADDIDALVDAMAAGTPVLTPSAESLNDGSFEASLKRLATNPSLERDVSDASERSPGPGAASCYAPRDKLPNSRTKFVNCAATGTRVNRTVKFSNFEIRVSEECGYIGGCVRGDVDHMGFTVYPPGGGIPLVNNHFSVYVPIPAPFICEDERVLSGIDTLIADVEVCQDLKKGVNWKNQKGEILKRMTERYNSYVTKTFKQFAQRATTQAVKSAAKRASSSFIEVISTFLRGSLNTFFIIIAIDPETGLPYGLPGKPGESGMLMMSAEGQTGSSDLTSSP